MMIGVKLHHHVGDCSHLLSSDLKSCGQESFWVVPDISNVASDDKWMNMIRKESPMETIARKRPCHPFNACGDGKGRLRDKGLQFQGVLVAEMGQKFVRVMSDPAASITMPILVG